MKKEPVRPSKYRVECALTSIEFKVKLPVDDTSVWCADDKRRDFGAMEEDIVHAMAVAAFYDKRRDRRDAGMNMLEMYDCRSKRACEDFLYLLDWGLKPSRSASPKDLIARAKQLRVKVAALIEERYPSRAVGSVR